MSFALRLIQRVSYKSLVPIHQNRTDTSTLLILLHNQSVEPQQSCSSAHAFPDDSLLPPNAITPSNPPSATRSSIIASIGSSTPASELALTGEPARFFFFSPVVGTLRRTSSLYCACDFDERFARKEVSGEMKLSVPMEMGIVHGHRA